MYSPKEQWLRTDHVATNETDRVPQNQQKPSSEYLSEFTSAVLAPISCLLQENTLENVSVGRNEANESRITNSNTDCLQDLNPTFAFRSGLLVTAGSIHISRKRNRLWLLRSLFDIQNIPSDGYRPHLALFHEIKRHETQSCFLETLKRGSCQKDDLLSNGLPRAGTEPSVMALVSIRSGREHLVSSWYEAYTTDKQEALCVQPLQLAVVSEGSQTLCIWRLFFFFFLMLNSINCVCFMLF